MDGTAAVEHVAAGRELLARAPLLAGADPATLDALARQVRIVRVQAGELAIRAGEAADRLYIVRSGRVRVLVERDDGPRVVRELGAGAAIGELSLLTGSERSASVQAIRDTELLELGADAFGEALRRDAGFAVSVARTLAVQLQASGELVPPPARPRVIAIGALGADVDVRKIGVELTAAFGRLGTSTLVTTADVGDDPFDALDRAEREHDVVVLLDAGEAPEWGALCVRQADRHVLLAGADAGESSAIPPACDLVAVGSLPPGALVRLLDTIAPRSLHHIDAGDRHGSIDRLARRLVGRALGVVLSGGGARGYAHIGALDALEEAGFDVDRIGGCSIGAFIGGMRALGLGTDAIVENCRRELVRRSPFNDYTLPRVSLIRSRKAGKMLERVFRETIMEELPISFFTVSADLLASRTVVHRRGDLVEAVGASMSIPGLVPPVSRPGRLLVDGGVLNNLPVDVMSADDEGPIVAIDVIRRLADVEGSVVPPVPSIMETLSRATVLGSVERAERNRRLADLVVTPDVQDVALREFSALDRATEVGRAAMRDALESGGAELLREKLSA